MSFHFSQMDKKFSTSAAQKRTSHHVSARQSKLIVIRILMIFLGLSIISKFWANCWHWTVYYLLPWLASRQSNCSASSWLQSHRSLDPLQPTNTAAAEQHFTLLERFRVTGRASQESWQWQNRQRGGRWGPSIHFTPLQQKKCDWTMHSPCREWKVWRSVWVMRAVCRTCSADWGQRYRVSRLDRDGHHCARHWRAQDATRVFCNFLWHERVQLRSQLGQNANLELFVSKRGNLYTCFYTFSIKDTQII